MGRSSNPAINSEEELRAQVSPSSTHRTSRDCVEEYDQCLRPPMQVQDTPVSQEVLSNSVIEASRNLVSPAASVLATPPALSAAVAQTDSSSEPCISTVSSTSRSGPDICTAASSS